MNAIESLEHRLFLHHKESWAELKEMILVSGGHREQMKGLLLERLSGIPLHYVTGKKYFYRHEYSIQRGIFIPRFETEVLVDTAVRRLKIPKLGFEIGLGSGIISIELLSRFVGLKMVATEKSESAIEIAKQNARSILGENWNERLKIIKNESVLLAEQQDKYDFLISNPPYLSHHDLISDEVLKYEPQEALFPTDGDPLSFYRVLARSARESVVFLELATERAEETRNLFIKNGWSVELILDLTSRPRVLVAERNG